MKAYINPQWAEALGLTLFDSLWQGALVLIASFVVLLFMKKTSPAKRYYVVLVAILILPILSVTTFLGHLDTSVTTSAINTPLNFENDAVFSLELGEATTPVEQAIIPQTPLAKWKAWTSKNASWALAVWLFGAFLFTVRMLGGFYFLNRLKSRSTLITDSVWLDKLTALSKALKIKGKVLLKQSEKVSSPLVMGVIKPVIIFPLGLIQALPTDEIEAILVHELAHIKRKDFLINIVINLLQVVYFFHPAFWWLKAQLDAEREYHCDDIALNQLGKKLTLIRALTNASEYQGQKFQPALAFAGKRNQLLNRVKRIVYHKPQMNWLSGFMSLGILVLSFVLMSQNESRDKTPEMADLEENNIENLMQEPALQDTTKVKKAILELLKPDSKVTVKTDASGKVTMIMNDKTEITGDEYEAYKKAYNQIHKFSEESQKTQEELSQELSEKVELEAERSAKIQADHEILRAQKVLKEVEEVMKASAQSKTFEVEKAEVTQQEIVEWVKKEKEIQEEEQLAELVRLEEKLAAEKIQEDTARMAFSPIFESIKTKGKISPEDSNLLYEIDGRLVEKDAFFLLKTEEVLSISVLKSVPEILAAHPEVKIKNPALLQIVTAKNRSTMTIKSLYGGPEKFIYELDNKMIEQHEINKVVVDQLKAVEVLTNQTYIRKKYPKVKGDDLTLIRLSTKKENDLVPLPTIEKTPFTATAKSRDFTSVEFGNSLTYNSQLEYIKGWLGGETFIIELDGELSPEMTFVDINHMDGLKIKTFEIIKNDKMYDYHKKRKLKGYDALIRIVTK